MKRTYKLDTSISIADNIANMLYKAIPMEMAIFKLQGNITISNGDSVTIRINDSNSITFDLYHNIYGLPTIHLLHADIPVNYHYEYLRIFVTSNKNSFRNMLIKSCKKPNTFSLAKIKKAYNEINRKIISF